jgi:2-C-methyl-D-erythritol 4-phosphate cytidylyltransferase/2-C-methyl-D-erythritol 2,4-cyclodiphosphate synthase
VTDAVLGACVLGDIGDHFPSSDPRWEGAASMQFVDEAMRMAADAGWSVSHLDATVIAETVRIAEHRDAIRSRLATALGCDVEQVSVKATSTDGLGYVGRGEGIAAVAVVTVNGSA